MAAGPLPGLSLGISPSSSAYADTGLDMVGGYGGSATGSVNLGAGSDSWLSGVVRDLAIGIAVALAAKWLWGKIK